MKYRAGKHLEKNGETIRKQLRTESINAASTKSGDTKSQKEVSVKPRIPP